MTRAVIAWRDEFASIGELCARIGAPLTTPAHDSGRNDRPSPWNGDVTLAQAATLARDGWPDGRAAWSDAYAADFAGFVTPAATVTYDVAGAFPDIPRAVAGDPACFADRGADSEHKPVVTVAVNLGASASTSEMLIRNRGLALLAAIDRAEQQGARVELIGVMASKTFDGRVYAATVALKAADQHADIDKLAFTLSHPAMLRRLLFNAMETHEGRPLAVLGSSYGTPCDLRELFPAGAVYLSAMTHDAREHYATPDKAFGYVNQLINRAVEVRYHD